MPLDGFRMSIFGDVQVERRLGTIKGRIGDPTPLWYALMGWLAKVEYRQFESQGKSGSGGWKELAKSTVARKAALGLDQRILFATWRLFNAWTNATEDSVRKVSKTEMVFGVNVPYAKYHQPDRQGRREVELARQQRRTVSRAMLRFAVNGDIRIGR